MPIEKKIMHIPTDDKLKSLGYPKTDLSSLLMNFPTTITVQKKSDNTFCAYTPSASVGIFEGAETPEDAVKGLIFARNELKSEPKKLKNKRK